ncbi:MAG: hypothetical protein RI947_911 [Candidatus Parcubacteria bacterium]|jgi:hypothetical protein
MSINAEWHNVHKMPKNPTNEQRFSWHLEHAKHCACRKMSDKLRTEIKEWQVAHEE